MMKTSSITLAFLAACAASASAQTSSVTLFGVVDLGVRAVKNGDGSTVKSVTDGGLAVSRIGFRGEEDLGGGLKAGFWLEAPMAVDTGAAGTPAGAPTASGATIGAKFFQRRATVSLSGAFGEVRLGRDFNPSFLNLALFDAYGTTGFAGNGNLLGGGSLAAVGLLGSAAGTIARNDNAVSYFLPGNLGGFYGQAMASAGEGTNATNGNNRYVGVRAGWRGGPVDVAGGYGRTRIPGSDDYRVWNVGASYDAKVVKVMALYHHADFTPAGLGNRFQKFWGLGATVPLGVGEIRATYQRSDIGGGGAVVGLRDQDDARQYAVGYIHNLSKRTAVYADVGRIDNRGLSTLAYPGGTAAGSNFGVVADRSSTAFNLGVRHSF